MQLSIRRAERGAGLPTASFIIICLAGGSESGQTEQTPSIFLLLFRPLQASFLSFSSFQPLLCMKHPSLSHSLHLNYFLSSFYSFSSLLLVLCCSVCHRCTPCCFLAIFYHCFALYLLLFFFIFGVASLSFSLTLVLLIFPICFAFNASLPLPLFISALQFSSSFLHFSCHHLSVTQDVFHFSSFCSNLSLHPLH